jgi:hypothetical protein
MPPLLVLRPLIAFVPPLPFVAASCVRWLLVAAIRRVLVCAVGAIRIRSVGLNFAAAVAFVAEGSRLTAPSNEGSDRTVIATADAVASKNAN